jgi:hypothetical protein
LTHASNERCLFPKLTFLASRQAGFALKFLEGGFTLTGMLFAVSLPHM